MSLHKVYPREPMTAFRREWDMPGGYWVEWPYWDLEALGGAEFAAAFRPAEHLEQLLAAARGVVAYFDGAISPSEPLRALCEALRQWEAS